MAYAWLSDSAMLLNEIEVVLMELFLPLVIAIVVVVVIQWRRKANSLASKTHPKENQPKQVKVTPAHKSSVGLRSAVVGNVEIDINISDDEIEPKIQEFAFLFEGKRPKQLVGNESWYKKRNQNAFLKSEPDRAIDWALPFIPKEIAAHERVRPQVENGLEFGGPSVSGFRKIVKERRAAGEPCHDWVAALYGMAVLHEFENALKQVRIGHGHDARANVALKDLQGQPADYQRIGYNFLSHLQKTDIKWLVAEFGEPEQHMAVKDFYADVLRVALSRRLWSEFRERRTLQGPVAEVKANMDAWLREQLKMQLAGERLQKEQDRQYSIARENKQAELDKRLPEFPGFERMSFYKEKIVGVSMLNADGSSRQKWISRMRVDEKVELVRNPDNPHGSNAIEVHDMRGHQIGFIEAFRAGELAPQMDKGYKIESWVDRILGGDSGKKFGVVVAIQRYKPKPT